MMSRYWRITYANGSWPDVIHEESDLNKKIEELQERGLKKGKDFWVFNEGGNSYDK